MTLNLLNTFITSYHLSCPHDDATQGESLALFFEPGSLLLCLHPGKGYMASAKKMASHPRYCFSCATLEQ